MFEVDGKAREVLNGLTAELSRECRQQVDDVLGKAVVGAAEIERLHSLLPPTLPFYRFCALLLPEARLHERPPPSPEYLERIERLKREQEQRAYSQMVCSVDAGQGYGQRSLLQDFGQDLRETNRHLIAIVNMLLTVAGAFVFGYYGINFAYPALRLDEGTKMVLGLVFATIVFLADLYFIAKTMDTDQAVQELEQRRGKERVFRLDPADRPGEQKSARRAPAKKAKSPRAKKSD